MPIEPVVPTSGEAGFRTCLATAGPRACGSAPPDNVALLEALWSRKAPAQEQPPDLRQAFKPCSSPSRSKPKQYGSWWMNPDDWHTVYGGRVDEDVIQSRLGCISKEEIMQRNEMESRRAELQDELGNAYTVKVYREYMQEHNLIEPAAIARVPTPTDQAMIKTAHRRLQEKALAGASTTQQQQQSPRQAKSSLLPAPTTHVGFNRIHDAELDLDEIITPDMRDNVRRTLAMNEMLQKHTAVVDKMQQQRQALEAGWAQATQERVAAVAAAARRSRSTAQRFRKPMLNMSASGPMRLTTADPSSAATPGSATASRCIGPVSAAGAVQGSGSVRASATGQESGTWGWKPKLDSVWAECQVDKLEDCKAIETKSVGFVDGDEDHRAQDDEGEGDRHHREIHSEDVNVSAEGAGQHSHEDVGSWAMTCSAPNLTVWSNSGRQALPSGSIHGPSAVDAAESLAGDSVANQQRRKPEHQLKRPGSRACLALDLGQLAEGGEVPLGVKYLASVSSTPKGMSPKTVPHSPSGQLQAHQASREGRHGRQWSHDVVPALHSEVQAAVQPAVRPAALSAAAAAPCLVVSEPPCTSSLPIPSAAAGMTAARTAACSPAASALPTPISTARPGLHPAKLCIAVPSAAAVCPTGHSHQSWDTTAGTPVAGGHLGAHDHVDPAVNFSLSWVSRQATLRRPDKPAPLTSHSRSSSSSRSSINQEGLSSLGGTSASRLARATEPEARAARASADHLCLHSPSYSSLCGKRIASPARAATSMGFSRAKAALKQQQQQQDTSGRSVHAHGSMTEALHAQPSSHWQAPPRSAPIASIPQESRLVVSAGGSRSSLPSAFKPRILGPNDPTVHMY